MISIAIAEDDPKARDQYTQFLQTFRREYRMELEVTMYPDGQSLLGDFRSQFDLILLDIEMPQLDGMTTAQMLRRSDPEVLILFITNMAQYAIRGYEVDAMDYILKPITYFAFSQRLTRAISRIRRREERHYLVVTVKGGTQKLDVATLQFVESQGHNLVFHTTQGDVAATGTMKEVEEKLESLNFFRCNKGYLVSLAHVDGVQDGCALVGRERLLISRGRKGEFLEALAQYLSNHSGVR